MGVAPQLLQNRYLRFISQDPTVRQRRTLSLLQTQEMTFSAYPMDILFAVII